MIRVGTLLVAMWLAAAAFAAERPAGSLEAVTAGGEKVHLLPDGRWEYADPKKAEPQRRERAAEDARERAAQGGFLGIGRKIYPGDPDYNRGSLNPNRR